MNKVNKRINFLLNLMIKENNTAANNFENEDYFPNVTNFNPEDENEEGLDEDEFSEANPNEKKFSFHFKDSGEIESIPELRKKSSFEKQRTSFYSRASYHKFEKIEQNEDEEEEQEDILITFNNTPFAKDYISPRKSMFLPKSPNMNNKRIPIKTKSIKLRRSAPSVIPFGLKNYEKPEHHENIDLKMQIKKKEAVLKLNKEILLAEEKLKTNSGIDTHVSKDVLPDYLFARMNYKKKLFEPSLKSRSSLYSKEFNPKGFKSINPIKLKNNIQKLKDTSKVISKLHSKETDAYEMTPKDSVEFLPQTASATSKSAVLNSSNVSNSNSTCKEIQKYQKNKNSIPIKIDKNVNADKIKIVDYKCNEESKKIKSE